MRGSVSGIIFGVWLFLSVAPSHAQEVTVLNAGFKDTPFRDFATFLSRGTGYRIFYDPIALDSFNVTVVINEQSVSSALEEVFRETDISFAIDNQRNVFIIKGYDVQTSLPDDFFSGAGNGPAPKQIFPLELLETRRKTNESDEGAPIEVGPKTKVISTGNAYFTGNIRERRSGEPVSGATLFVEALNRGVVADEFGEFSIYLPMGAHEFVVNAVGMEPLGRKIVLYGNGRIDIDMDQHVASLKEVVVTADRNINITGQQMGFDRLDIGSMKQVLAAMGEVDVFRVALTLPGVQTAGEGTTGLNIRGGATDQNLILFNDAVVFKPNHLFGFFTAFNPDLIKQVEVVKSGISADRGGRLSSVVDISTREGNRKEITGSGGIGLLTGRFSIEGPLFRDKTSFLIGGRSTYSNWLLKQVPDDDISQSQASFYDMNLSVNHEANNRDNFHLSAYYSHDGFKLKDDTLYQYSNAVASLKWKHTFSNRFQSIALLSHSNYSYSLAGRDNPVNAFNFSNKIGQSDLKLDFNYFPREKHLLRFGLQTSHYRVRPGSLGPRGSESLVSRDQLQRESALETALYIGDDIEINHVLSVHPGIRYSFYNALGPRNVFHYGDVLSKHEDNIVDTVKYGSGSSVAFYHGPEFRVSVKYIISEGLSVKGSYNRMRQYVQTLSNTTSISPTDVWKLSDFHIQPQVGNQVSLGIYKNFNSGLIETSAEVYYKTMDNALDYKDGAKFILNHTIEADVVNVDGKAYGIELMAKKSHGKLNGWLNYTYSRSLLRTEDNGGPEQINHGDYYPSSYDKPHAANLIGNYRLSHRFSVSLNATYSTGRPVTLPIAKYHAGGSEVILYSERNQFRVPDYFRVDLSINIEGNHRIKKLAHSSWTVGVYNLTGRRNIYSVFFRGNDAAIRGYSLAVFGVPIPTISYNFRF